MSGSNNYINFYSGTEIEVLRIKDLLEGEEIPSIIQNDFQSGNIGGFIGGTPSTIRLKVRESDVNKANTLLKNLG
ncbi:Putative signal transducing protein [Salegentibacter echinorum]|uniref:Putative signal transducing protein n=1 Tax=Salegentibacter echinorum TaxID=1073325 RepID=A0A1M5GAS7_SALEC|nr:DUF2007 domain-containing protein [Salegentibacter echinorum]SHG00843.1 Putative signal transducing protein [Salegentibacter echinorum]